jgi:hypothetical protein
MPLYLEDVTRGELAEVSSAVATLVQRIRHHLVKPGLCSGRGKVELAELAERLERALNPDRLKFDDPRRISIRPGDWPSSVWSDLRDIRNHFDRVMEVCQWKDLCVGPWQLRRHEPIPLGGEVQWPNSRIDEADLRKMEIAATRIGESASPPRPLVASYVGTANAETLQAIRNVIADWDGTNWSAVRECLRQDGRTPDELDTMTMHDVRMAFAIGQKRFLKLLGGTPYTATNSIDSLSPSPKEGEPIPDGPFPPDSLYRHGKKAASVSGYAFGILNYLWPLTQKTAHVDDVAEAVWGVNQCPTSDAIESAKRRANDALREAGFKEFVSLKNKYLVIA